MNKFCVYETDLCLSSLTVIGQYRRKETLPRQYETNQKRLAIIWFAVCCTKLIFKANVGKILLRETAEKKTSSHERKTSQSTKQKGEFQKQSKFIVVGTIDTKKMMFSNQKAWHLKDARELQ